MRRKTLVALSAVCAALALLVALDRPRRPSATDDRLLAFDAEAVARIEIAAAGRAPVALARDGDALRLIAPEAVPTDERAVRDFIETAARLTWERAVPRDAARGLDERRLTLTLELDDGRKLSLAFGAAEPALDSVWAVASDDPRAFLVGAWAFRALDVAASDLRDRAPFSTERPAGELVIESGPRRIWIHGDPACVELERGCARADARRVARFGARLDDLRVTRFVSGDVPTPALRVVHRGEELRVGGACPTAPGERLIASRLGAACVASELVDEWNAAVDDPATWIERALFTAPGARLRRAEVAAPGSALALERRGNDWVAVGPDGARVPASTEAVRDWLDELGELRATSIVAVPPPDPSSPRVTLISDRGSETVMLHSVVDGRARFVRPGEPVALELPGDVARTVLADRLAFRDRTLVSFDPFALRAVEIEGEAGPERAERGESASEWRLTAPLAIAADGDTIGALRDAAHQLVARRAAAERATAEHGLPRRRVTLVVDPPPTAPDGAPPARHTVELGARAPDASCYARRDGDATVFVLDPDACDALDARLATRQAFDAPGGSIVAIAIGDRRYEKQGSAWYQARGGRISDDEAARLLALIRALELAPDVAGYAEVARGVEIEIRTDRATIRLRVSGSKYSVDGRPVSYRVPRDVCSTWKNLCD